MTVIADSVYEGLGPHREDDVSGDLHAFVRALTAPLDEIYEIVGETADRVGWEVVFDPAACPVRCLPWLAQWVGVAVTPSMSEAEIRQAIAVPEGQSRGSRAAIESAIKRTLTGTKRVIIHERTPTATDLYIRTLTAETPDSSATLAAILLQLPAWLILDYAAAAGMTYIDVASEWSTYADLEAEGLTYDELESRLP